MEGFENFDRYKEIEARIRPTLRHPDRRATDPQIAYARRLAGQAPRHSHPFAVREWHRLTSLEASTLIDYYKEAIENYKRARRDGKEG